MKKTRNSFQLIICILLIYFFISPYTNVQSIQKTPSCSYGTFDAWFSKDGRTWYNTTIDDVILSRGEAFFVKTQVTALKEPVWIALLFFEPGVSSTSTATFELVEDAYEKKMMVDLGQFSLYESREDVWKFRVKPNASWVNATTPLNIGAFFDVKYNNTWLEEDITFTIANMYIEDTLWFKSVDDELRDNSHQIMQSHFPFIILLISVVLVTFFIYKHSQKHV